VVELTLGMHRERRRLLLVERAQAHPVVPHPAQLHGLADQLDEVGGGAHALHPVVAARTPSHRGWSHRRFTTVTPRPPSPTPPSRWAATWGWPRRWRSTTARSTPFPTPWTTRSSWNPPITARSSA